jgi:hypothetical protein
LPSDHGTDLGTRHPEAQNTRHHHRDFRHADTMTSGNHLEYRQADLRRREEGRLPKVGGDHIFAVPEHDRRALAGQKAVLEQAFSPIQGRPHGSRRRLLQAHS